MAKELRKGMWVVHRGRIAILNDFKTVELAPADGSDPVPTEMGDVHYVGATGETLEVALVDPRELAQAAFLDIPEARRPTEAVARKFGYL